MSYVLGVDLGTTYTAAAVGRPGGPGGQVATEVVSLGYQATVVPSVVFVSAEGEVLVGEPAIRRGATGPARLAREFKRRMGDSVPLLLGDAPWSAEALTARLLSWVVDKVTEQEGGPPQQVTLTYPANWGPFKQERLVQAWHLAGLDDVSMITEPEAAAMSYAAVERVPVGQVVAVYDLGGGTFDAAVLRKAEPGFEVLGTPQGIERLGGIDIDAAVFAYVQRHVDLPAPDPEDGGAGQALARLKADCVEAKEALSSDTQVTIPVLFPNLHTEVRLTRSELEGMVRPQLQDSVTALRRAIASADLDPDDVHRVLLVGGSSRMPVVGQMVSDLLGRPFFVDAHPKHAVPLGAAQFGAGANGVVSDVGAAGAAVEPEEPQVTQPSRVTEPSAYPPPHDVVAGDQQPVAEHAGAVQSVEPEPPGDRRRLLLMAAAGAAAVLLLVILGLVLLGDGDDPTETVDSSGPSTTAASTTTTEPAGPPQPELVGTTPVPRLPDGIVADGDDLWVASTFGNAVSRIDVETGEVELQVPLEGEPLAVVVAEGSVWVTQRAADTVARLDPTDGTVLATIEAAGEPTAVAYGAGAIWVAGVDGPFHRIDPATNTSEEVGDFPGGTGVVADDEAVWLPYGDNLVAVVDPETYEVRQEVEVGDTPDVATMAPSGLWVANRQGGTVSRIDPETYEVTATVEIGTGPAGLAADGDWLWVVDYEEQTLVLVDEQAAEVVDRLDVGGGPLAVAATPGDVWISLGSDGAVARVDTSP